MIVAGMKRSSRCRWPGIAMVRCRLSPVEPDYSVWALKVLDPGNRLDSGIRECSREEELSGHSSADPKCLTQGRLLEPEFHGLYSVGGRVT